MESVAEERRLRWLVPAICLVLLACTVATFGLFSEGHSPDLPWMPLLTWGPIPAVLANDECADAITLDDTHLYWTSCGRANQLDGTVRRVLLAGGAVEDLVTGQVSPQAIVQDRTAIYWIDAGNDEGKYRNSGVRRRAKAGGAVETLVSGVSLLLAGLAVDEGRVYFTTDEGLFAVPATGGEVVVRFRGKTGALAVLRGNIFLTSDRRLLMLPKTGEAPISLLELPATAHALAVDDSGIYLALYPSYGEWARERRDGEVWKIPFGGGAYEILAVGRSSTWGLYLDKDYVYWISFDDHSLVRAAKSAKGSMTLVAGLDNGFGLVGNDTHLFWYENREDIIRSLPKAPPAFQPAGSPLTIRNRPHQKPVVTISSSQTARDVDARESGVLGPQPEMVAVGQTRVPRLAADDHYLYWVTDGGMFVVPCWQVDLSRRSLPDRPRPRTLWLTTSSSTGAAVALSRARLRAKGEISASTTVMA